MNPPSTLASLIGAELADELTPSQQRDVWNAIADNQDGVERIAREAMSKPGITNPAGYLIAKLRFGAHTRSLEHAHAEHTRSSYVENLLRIYYHRLADHPELGKTAALEYTIDYHAPGRSDIEDELRKRTTHDPNPPATLEQAERWQRIIRIAEKLHGQPDHPLRIAIRETCNHPDRITEEDALTILDYLEAITYTHHLQQP